MVRQRCRKQRAGLCRVAVPLRTISVGANVRVVARWRSALLPEGM